MFRPNNDDLMTRLGFVENASFTAECYPVFSLLKAINITSVDYFSLDIEGAELPVLKTIPWNRVRIKVNICTELLEIWYNHAGKLISRY